MEVKAPNSGCEIVLYQPSNDFRLEVTLQNDSVWLSIEQIAKLFDRDRSVIGKHIRAIFREQELEKNSVWAIFAYTAKDGKTYNVDFYNLDVIISVGYRVKSQRGTQFRIWANKVLKNYLLKGYSLNEQFLLLQERVKDAVGKIEKRVDEQQKQIDFFIKTSVPPAEMVFFNGDFFIARVALENLIKTANSRVIIIDAYVDAKTFDILDTRKDMVYGAIYTKTNGDRMLRLQMEHNKQVDVQPIDVFKWKEESHDRWLIIDDKLYHCGHSFNAIGGKISAITLMGMNPEVVLNRVK